MLNDKTFRKEKVKTNNLVKLWFFSLQYWHRPKGTKMLPYWTLRLDLGNLPRATTSHFSHLVSYNKSISVIIFGNSLLTSKSLPGKVAAVVEDRKETYPQATGLSQSPLRQWVQFDGFAAKENLPGDGGAKVTGIPPAACRWQYRHN